MKDGKQIDNITRLKQLQLQKMEEEVEKVRIEKERADYEFEKLKTRDNRPWYKKENFLRIGTQIFVGLAVLGFYIKFILTPIFQKDAINSQLDIAKQKKELNQNQIRLDSLKDQLILYSEYLNKKDEELSYEKRIRREQVDSLENLKKLELSILKKENQLLIKKNSERNQSTSKENNLLNTKISILQDSLKTIKSAQESLAEKISEEDDIRGKLKYLNEKYQRLLDLLFKRFVSYMQSNISNSDIHKKINDLSVLFAENSIVENVNDTTKKSLGKFLKQYGKSKQALFIFYKYAYDTHQLNNSDILFSSLKKIDTNKFTFDATFEVEFSSSTKARSSEFIRSYITLEINTTLNDNGLKDYDMKIKYIKFKKSDNYQIIK